MKKSFLSIVAASLMLCGCHIHQDYETYEIIKQGTDMFVDYIDAQGNKWEQSGTYGKPGYYIYQEYEFPEITQNVLDNGAVLVYLVDADGRDNILPYVFHFDNGSELVMQNIRFDVEKGILTLIIEWQDFCKYPQGDYRFKVCILQPGESVTGKK